jgi:hypothetical protein
MKMLIRLSVRPAFPTRNESARNVPTDLGPPDIRTEDGSSPASGGAARRISACRLFGGFFFHNRG